MWTDEDMQAAGVSPEATTAGRVVLFCAVLALVVILGAAIHAAA